MRFVFGLFLSVLCFLTAPLHAAEPPVIVGQIIEEKAWPDIGLNHDRGVQLAVSEINAAGGVHGGHPIKLITRDGGSANPEDVVRDAEELVNRDGAHFLIGTVPDNNSLAVESFAEHNHVFFIKGVNGSMRMIWAEGNPYFAHFGEPNYMFGGALAEAAAKTGIKRWSFIGPDYEFGHSVVAEFQKALLKKEPDATWIKELYFPLGKINASLAAQTLQYKDPDGLFVALWGSDLMGFIREGNRRHLFDNKKVVAVLLGQPEGMKILGKETPVGWITQGWPFDDITIPEHKAFLAAYRKTYGAEPGYCSYVGYNAMKALAAAMDGAKDLTPEGVSAAIARQGLCVFARQTGNQLLACGLAKRRLLTGNRSS